MTDSKEWCDGDWRCRSSSKPFAGAESGSPGRALEAGKRGSPGRPVQAGIRGKRLNKHADDGVQSVYINLSTSLIGPRPAKSSDKASVFGNLPLSRFLLKFFTFFLTILVTANKIDLHKCCYFTSFIISVLFGDVETEK